MGISMATAHNSDEVRRQSPLACLKPGTFLPSDIQRLVEPWSPYPLPAGVGLRANPPVPRS